MRTEELNLNESDRAIAGPVELQTQLIQVMNSSERFYSSEIWTVKTNTHQIRSE